MAYVPKNAEWFLAKVVLEIRVAGSRRNVVHINYVVIRANSPDKAYQRALAFGKRCASSYKNPLGKKVTVRFRGLGNLDVISDPLGDECEIMYFEKLGVSEKGIRRLVRPKPKLEVFMPVRGRLGRPDYSPGKIVIDLVESLHSQVKPPVKPPRPQQPTNGEKRLRGPKRNSSGGAANR